MITHLRTSWNRRQNEKKKKRWNPSIMVHFDFAYDYYVRSMIIIINKNVGQRKY